MCRYYLFLWRRISRADDDSIVEYIPHHDPVAIRWPACRDVLLSLSLETEYAFRSWAGLNDEGNFDEGSIAIIAAGREVRWDRPRGGSAAIHVFLSERSIRHAALEADDARPLEIISATDARDSELEFAVRRLHMELAGIGGGSKLHRDVLLGCIASRVGRAHAEWAPRQRLPRRRLTAFDAARVHDYVRLNPASDVGIDTLAALVRRGPYDFMRLFKFTTGHTVHQYVTRLRIEIAREKLRNRRAGELSLADLSAELGFADQSHFTRCFRRATGSTPGRYLRDAGQMPARSTGGGGASVMEPTICSALEEHHWRSGLRRESRVAR
jgi:AraC family transcriptional regulator